MGRWRNVEKGKRKWNEWEKGGGAASCGGGAGGESNNKLIITINIQLKKSIKN